MFRSDRIAVKSLCFIAIFGIVTLIQLAKPNNQVIEASGRSIFRRNAEVFDPFGNSSSSPDSVLSTPFATVAWDHLVTAAPDWEDAACDNLNSYNNDSCTYVREAAGCQATGFLNYLPIAYCDFHSKALAIFVLIVWLFFLFVALTTTAELFFCPTMSTISQTLKISHNVAGVTFVSVGNSIPDIFAILTAVNSVPNGISLALGEVFGSGLFITTVVFGVVAIFVPFNLTRRPFVRDAIFYLLATGWTLGMLLDRKIYVEESISLLVFYGIYIAVVVVGRKVFQTRKISLFDGDGLGFGASTLINDTEDLNETDDEFHADRTYTDMRSTGHDFESEPFKELMTALNPFTEWDQRSIGGKIFEVIKAPIKIILTLTTPVVNLEVEKQNWCRFLSVIQCITAPIFVVFAAGVGTYKIGGQYPIWMFAFMIGSILSVIIWSVTLNSVQPKYHRSFFTFMGFCMSVVWIYCFANEIVNLLLALGVILSIGSDVLGLTALAWGNSVGDFVANVAIGRKGYPQMAVGACFGSPMINLLVGFGASTTYATIKNQSPIIIQLSSTIILSASALIFTILCSLIIIPFNSFMVGRRLGVFFIGIYLAFIVAGIILITLQ